VEVFHDLFGGGTTGKREYFFSLGGVRGGRGKRGNTRES
jgi:hypothetical protein